MFKYLKKNPKVKNALIIIAVILAIPLSYLLGGYHLVDSWLSNQVEAQTNNMIQNHYINSVKRNVTPNDVADVERKINYIYDNNLKNKLREDTNAILKQAELQSKLLSQIQTDYDADDLSNIKIKNVKLMLTKAQDVLNPQVRTEILRKGNTVLDRSVRTHKAIVAVDSLFKQKRYSRNDLSKYYTAMALVDLAYGKKAKSNLRAKLRIVYDKLNQKLSQSEKAKQKAVKEAIAGLKNNHFTGGNANIETNKLSSAEMSAFKVLNSKQVGLYLSLADDTISGYQLSSSKTNVDNIFHDDAVITPGAKKYLSKHDGYNLVKVDHKTIQFSANNHIIYITADTDFDDDNVIIIDQTTIDQLLAIIKSTKAIIHLSQEEG